MKILISDRLDAEAVALLRERGFDVVEAIGVDPGALQTQVADADAWIVRSGTQVTDRLLQCAKQLKVVGRAGVGVDNIDIAAATRGGVAVLNTPTGNTIAAVEHTIALLLALARHIPEAHNSLLGEGSWERSRFTGVELYGKTIGLLGLGKIGARVASRCRGLEMTVIAYDPFVSTDRAKSLGVQLAPDLQEVLARSDFLSLHLPGTPETAEILNAENLQRCKKGVRIVNCARGNLIDEAALAQALTSGHVAGAALDVFVDEPPTGSPLLQAPNLVATPHLGASTVESQRKVGMQIAEQVADALASGVFREAINIPVQDWGSFSQLKPQLVLVERLGQVAQQQAGGAISRVEVEYCGSGFSEVRAINSMLLKGLLKPVLGESVNAVNAPLLAEERGIELAFTEREHSSDYQTLVKLRIDVAGRQRTLAGTTFADQEPRLVEIDGYDVELFLLGVLLVFGNLDCPGVIGDVGTVLGKHAINVAHFSLGRKRPGGEALGVVAVDEEIPANVLQELSALQNMSWVCQVVLDS
ncbi:MAG: phosphoglycerate dehydrogenase [Gammaproteobacteria bacterium]|nr:phosphoglycerate dehydrogenase [Gammaproteobacteria bacterium]